MENVWSDVSSRDKAVKKDDVHFYLDEGRGRLVYIYFTPFQYTILFKFLCEKVCKKKTVCNRSCL